MTSPRRVVHELVSELDYPMFIVTVAAQGERAGCLVGFTTQCSIVRRGSSFAYPTRTAPSAWLVVRR